MMEPSDTTNNFIYSEVIPLATQQPWTSNTQ